ncbi:hypothetical protein E2C01_025781 [Portunus trituberculatus]|uniref:Uncharacterized protein n=1 Tax=Portunus trituberculatus TaxID=210409 RepID=A0A5B7EDU7_PORTR|nr:hypothetical protein [Portunus trituberculatus]
MNKVGRPWCAKDTAGVAWHRRQRDTPLTPSTRRQGAAAAAAAAAPGQVLPARDSGATCGLNVP